MVIVKHFYILNNQKIYKNPDGYNVNISQKQLVNILRVTLPESINNNSYITLIENKLNTIADALDWTNLLLSASNEIEFNRVFSHRYLNNYGDCKTFFIHSIIHSRHDLNDNLKKAYYQIWDNFIISQKRQQPLDIPTVNWSSEKSSIFSKL